MIKIIASKFLQAFENDMLLFILSTLLFAVVGFFIGFSFRDIFITLR